ncbi:hemoglobin/transferrin/lactoferrin receptor protein [Povalibacter uvarum]|uniref:Hemoglobin/transferrin/lactoferrin receptor protein n=1 Tax=Povalibacter uvarum TaxID=732238 RepID=A0A841HMT5_9GAMM|nr:TonB-dependent hemoglobin/transferrin/lactoferrin family receptor [Povalibacter uvarum]MBB6094186.1 hemoglobin/transferrin/lactoferrin receptor protein [Povalibacter uvarum]
MRTQLRCVIAYSLFCASVAAAANNDQADSPARIEQELKKISVTATRGPRELDGIASTVTVKDAAEIEAELASDIKDLVRYEPGISVGNAPTRFGLAGFNIRGIDGNRVLIRIDDVRMSDAFAIGSFSDARRNLVDLDAVKSMEIIRGAASALYGSDAIGGVVSFVMKDPVDYIEPGRSSYFSVKSGYQSDDDGVVLGGTLALGNDTLSGLVNLTRRTGHERENHGDVESNDRTRTAPNPQDYDSDSLLAKLSWTPNEDNIVRLTVDADRSDVETDVLSGVGVSGTGATAVNTLSLLGDDSQERNRISLGHEFFATTAVSDSVEWQVYWQETNVEQRTAERRHSVLAGPGATVQRDREFDFEQSLWGAELLLRKDLSIGSSEHRFTYGLDAVTTDTQQMRNGVQTNLATGARTSAILPDVFPVRDFPTTQTDQLAAYFQDEIAFGDGSWIVTPGVRVDYYKLDPRPDDVFTADNPGVAVTDLEDTSVSPKLGVVWSFTDVLSAYAQYAHGFRAPPYNDVNIGFTNLAFGYTAIANPDLKPETSDGYEIGLRGADGNSFFSVAAFYNEYEDLIESLGFVGIVNGLQVFQSRNVAEARIHGAELRAGVDLSAMSASLQGWTLKSSVAYARGDNRVTDEPLNSIDPLKGVLGIAYDSPSRVWRVELIGTAVERKERIDDSAGPQFAPPGYFTLDLLTHLNFGERVTVNVGIFNLTDEKYWEWADVRGRPAADPVIDRYTQPGVNASATATVRF